MTGDKNTILALVLIAALFFAYSLLVEKPKPKATAETATTTADTSVATLGTAQTGANTNSSPASLAVQLNQPAAANGVFPSSEGKTATNITLENEAIKLDFSTQGGRLLSSQLKKFATFDNQPLVLNDAQQSVFNYEFSSGSGLVRTQQYIFEVAEKTNQKLVFRLYSDSTKQRFIEQSYTLDTQNPYLVNYNFALTGFENSMPTNTPIRLMWGQALRHLEKEPVQEKTHTIINYKPANDDVTYVSAGKDGSVSTNEKLAWVSFTQQFFNTTIMPANGFDNGNLDLKYLPDNDSSRNVAIANANLAFSYQPSASYNLPMQWYIGPNKYEVLKKFDNELEDILYLGWGIFGWINKWVVIPIFNLLSKFIGSFGIIIILLTLIVKMVLMPLTYRSYKSFAKMNVLKPEIEEIRAKHPDDQQRVQQEMMKLYSKAGVNPLGGCLPQLLQMPIWIAMYRFFPTSVELRQQSFLWANDLSTYDAVVNLPFNIPFYGAHISLFCLLSATSNYFYMKLNNSTSMSSPEMQTQMKIMQVVFPIMMLFFFNNVSSGLSLYFFVSNMITFGQQAAIKRFFIDEKALHAQMQENKAKPIKQSKFQQRWAEMLEQAQEAQKRANEEKNKK